MLYLCLNAIIIPYLYEMCSKHSSCLACLDWSKSAHRDVVYGQPFSPNFEYVDVLQWFYLLDYIMLPTKLRALNDCSTDESSNNDDVPVKITKEALVGVFQLLPQKIYQIVLCSNNWMFYYYMICIQQKNLQLFLSKLIWYWNY